MAIRVVARIRPRQANEALKDVIVVTATNQTADQPTLVKIPNPKNESEDFTFQFSSVYDHTATQQQLFDNEGQRSCIALFLAFVDSTQSHLLSNTFSMDTMLQSSLMVVLELARLIP